MTDESGEGLDLWAALHLDFSTHLQKMDQYLEKLMAVEAAYEEQGPVFHRRGNGATSDASGSSFVIDLGGPAVHRRWEVRNIVVGGLTWTTVTGSALVVVGGARPPAPGSVSMNDVRDQAPVLPNPAFYSSGQLVLRNPERLYIVVLTPAASTDYVAAASIIETPDRPLRGVVNS